MFNRSSLALEAIPSHHRDSAQTFLMSPLPSLPTGQNASAQNNVCPLEIIILLNTLSVFLNLNGRYFCKKPELQRREKQTHQKKNPQKITPPRQLYPSGFC